MPGSQDCAQAMLPVLVVGSGTQRAAVVLDLNQVANISVDHHWKIRPELVLLSKQISICAAFALAPLASSMLTVIILPEALNC